jgi:hypothetical protein
MTGHSGNITLEELENRKCTRLNAAIDEHIAAVISLGARQPFSLMINKAGEREGEIIFTTKVEQINGEWVLDRNFREQIAKAKVDAVELTFEDRDHRTFVYPVYLTEMTKTTEAPTPGARHEQHAEGRKTANAAD